MQHNSTKNVKRNERRMPVISRIHCRHNDYRNAHQPIPTLQNPFPGKKIKKLILKWQVPLIRNPH